MKQSFIKTEEKMDWFNVCGVRVSAINLDAATKQIDEWICSRRHVYVCVAPASTIVDCQKNETYRSIVNTAAMVTPDGMPLVWLGKLKGKKNMSRTYGPDLMQAVCRMSQEKGYTQYFYGSTTETCRKLEAELKNKFPRLRIIGKFSPPFRDLSEEENDVIVEEINRRNPDILWIGLGSPKQDFWMARNRIRLIAPVIIGVGAAFDFLAGTKKQAPLWMRRSGLEWLFRLCFEPKRLWKRYLFGNTQFIFYVLQDLIIPRKVTRP